MREGGLQALGDRPLGEAHARQLGDVLGDVAHALERCADAQGAHDDAQVARDRLLAREDLDREFVERDGLLVDDDVGLDDLFGQCDVARAERPRRLVDRDRHEFGDLDETSLDVFEGLMEDFAHCSTFRVPQQARAWRPGDHRHRRLTNGAAGVNSNRPLGRRDTTGPGGHAVALYSGAMDTTQLALLALLLGAVIGGSVSAVIVFALRARDRALAETSSAIPDGVREVLHGMDDAAVVVDASSTVLAASAAAVPFHLAEGEVLPSDDLRPFTAVPVMPASSARRRASVNKSPRPEA